MVGVDGSEDALRAVRWGAEEARRLGVPLRLVTAFAWAGDLTAGPATGQRYREAVRRVAEEHVATAAAAAREAVPGIAVERQVAAGSAIEILGSESRYAQLLVLGDRGLSRLEGLLAGSVAVAVTTRAACPVVVVREGGPDVRAAAGPVVVGVDGSSTSEAATEFAFEAAATRGVRLVAVHTWWDLVASPALAALLDLEAIEVEERRRLSQRLAGWSEKYPEVRVEQSVSRAHPAPALIQLSTRAQLLVVGTRSRGELAGLVLGSVSNAVVHRARCPVAVVRPRSSGRQ